MESKTETTVTEVVEAWWPRGGSFTDVLLKGRVDLAREMVLAANPVHKKQATATLRYLVEFLEWCEGLDDERELSDDSINAFLDACHKADPGGTRDAIRSYLRRVKPGQGGFVRRTRTVKAIETPPVDDVAPELAVRVADAIDGYQLTVVDKDRWETVAPFVRDAVAASEPPSAVAAVDRCRAVGWLAVWADANHLPLQASSLFRADTLDRFANDAEFQKNTRRSYLSLCSIVGRALIPNLTSGHEVRTPGVALRGPYSDDEIELLFRAALRIQRIDVRRQVLSLLRLGLGAGLEGGSESGCVEPGEITTRDGLVIVSVSAGAGGERRNRWAQRREVPVDHRHATALLALRDETVAAGDKYMLGGLATRRPNRSALLAERFNSWKPAVRLEVDRLRFTWLVNVASRSAALVSVLDAAGLVSLDGLNGVLPYVATPNTDDFRRIAGLDLP